MKLNSCIVFKQNKKRQENLPKSIEIHKNFLTKT